VKVQCKHCQAVLTVPDEKVPVDRPLRATCSKCKNPITVGPKQKKQASQSQDAGAAMSLDFTGAEVTEAPTAVAIDLGTDPVYDSPLEFLQAGAMSALICVDEPERVKAVKTALVELNCHGSLASSVKEALSKLRYNHYDIVMLDEEFCGETAENNTILRYLQPMPMSTRRNIFVTLICKKHRTLDNLVAFAKSVNAVINVNDVPKVKMIIERALAEHRRFYKVFIDMLQVSGAI
jgi:predicted Zn finger-like uncharacterized protein